MHNLAEIKRKRERFLKVLFDTLPLSASENLFSDIQAFY